MAGVPMTGGFVFGPSLVNPQGTNAVAIYTAAEVAFNTQVGTTYQIQSISSLGDELAKRGRLDRRHGRRDQLRDPDAGTCAAVLPRSSQPVTA